MALTAAVIGCGNIVRFHFSGLEKAGARVKWICDINPEAAQPWVEKTGAAYTADYQEAATDPEVDVVVVTPISSLHKEMCLCAIEAGKAVICEKTLATNPEDAAAIIRAAETKGTLFYTAYMKRYMPAVAKARELLPEIGAIISSWIRSYQPWGRIWVERPQGSFLDKPADGPSEVVRRYGGGVLVCGGSHSLDLTHFFLGRPRKLYATMKVPEGSDFDLQAAVFMETDNGPVHYEVCAHPLDRIGFMRDGWDERLEINGVDGRLDVYISKWDQVETKTGYCVHYDNRTGEATEYRFPVESAFDLEVMHFCAQIEKGEQGPQGRDTGYVVDELIAHIGKSAAAGQAVAVEYSL